MKQKSVRYFILLSFVILTIVTIIMKVILSPFQSPNLFLIILSLSIFPIMAYILPQYVSIFELRIYKLSTLTSMVLISTILVFAFLIYYIDKQFPEEPSWQYSESIFVTSSSTLVLLIYLTIIQVLILRSNLYRHFFSSINVKLTIVSSLLRMSLIITLISLLDIQSCTDGMAYDLFLFIAAFGFVLINAIDFVYSLINKRGFWIKFHLIAAVLWSCYLVFFINIQKAYSNNGECELLLGPDDSVFFITFSLFTV